MQHRPLTLNTVLVMQVQQCCEGGSLADVLNRAAYASSKRHYSYGDALRWATQTAKALQYLHEAQPQIVYRNLKPENLMLITKGRDSDVAIVDFGLTKLRCALPAAALHVHLHA